MKRMIEEKKIAALEEKAAYLEVVEDGIVVNSNLGVDGGISSTGPIVEGMSGYSIKAYSVDPAKGTFAPIYSSVVKNGNKLTIVACGTFNRVAEATGSTYLFNVTIPSDIGAKLIPYDDTTLYAEITTAFNGLYGQKDTLIYFLKQSNTVVTIAFNYGQLTVNTDYYIRAEATFLLSENMTPPSE